jgi:trans-AT polyketide synthase/acyltransferase/oxidoreductase domain-containing protein
MGEGLFEEFSSLVQQADSVLGYSIEELCLRDPGDQLRQTQFTQPAIYVVNSLSYLKKIQTEEKPLYLAGHSVAEYNALFTAGAVDFSTGLQLVKKRGELMSRARDGGMAAVMGIVEDKVLEIIRTNNYKNLYVANINSTKQIVISGSKQEIQQAEQVFLDGGATHYKILNVSGAFHTPYMEEAKQEFAAFVETFEFKDPEIPVISNVTARPYSPGFVKGYIIEQITSPVRWSDSMRYILAKGIGLGDIEEIGSGGLSVVKALAMRVNNEVGPLDAGVLEAEENAGKKDIIQEKYAAASEPVKEKKETPKEKKRQPGILGKLKGKKKNRRDGFEIKADTLGSASFRSRYNLDYSYVGGGMYKGIASTDMVVRLGRAGMLGFFGSGGLSVAEVETAIRDIQSRLTDGNPYGVNLVSNPHDPGQEEQLVDLFLKYNIPVIEAAAYMTMTPALVKFRAKGLKKTGQGDVACGNHIIAKISRPEVAEQFLSPAPERIVKKLLEGGKISADEAEMLKTVPMADDLCVEADSGGHTDQGMPYALMPAMILLRDRMAEKYGYSQRINVGAAGGIGTPEAAAAALVMGADFVLTGSINQCSVEADTSDLVKDLLQEANVQDTEYAPAGDMFELGAKVQVLKKGLFFPARANKLYDLYRNFKSIDDIDEKTKKQLQDRFFKRSFNEIFDDCKSYYPSQEIEKAQWNAKHKMALIFRWYFGYASRLAKAGDKTGKIDFQIPCGPSLGAFNQWIKGTSMEDWRQRHVDEIGKKMMSETADLLTQRMSAFTQPE